MIWKSFSDFLSMGGYALYVWGSVIVTFGFMAAEVAILAMRRRTIVEQLGRANRLETEGDQDEAAA